MKALEWIEDRLCHAGSLRLYCGGLAVQAYGGTRPLNDIDLFIPAANFAPLVDELRDHIRKPAMRQREAGWDLTYVQFVYDGIKIEVGSDDRPLIQNGASGEWCPLEIDYTSAEYRSIAGLSIPVMARSHLIAYKRILKRDVDRVDIGEIA
ncbi:hypothetical protein TH25_15685 [Thalassospira profundimaris]|uniref:MazG-related protein n=1 Tax=Thalassospira profundimaris TaxID=502049 RepID=A0A367X234_9PROT|nr:hypothetical protein [Thalassospira profundimaris]RCK47707.1 hypothetical protein TH25_15685 [Thalassospira profundimaris]